MDFIAQCFGIDGKKYNYNSTTNAEEQESAIPIAILKTETQKSLRERAIVALKLKCQKCGQ